MTDQLQTAFAGRSVLVTGHTGFKGSWLALWLNHLGAQVAGYSLAPSTFPSNFAACKIDELLEQHIEADIRDATRLTSTVHETQPDFIFHLAAQPLVRESYRAPRDTFETNILGTVNLLEAVRNLNKPCVVVVVTTDKCYENREQVWGYREIDPMGGRDPYSASKGAAEIVVASYRASFFPPYNVERHGVKLASARAGNVIGGGDWSKDRIVVDLVHALRAGETVAVRNPRAVRPWQHVLEPLSGYLTLAAKLAASDDTSLCSAWNFGPLPGDAAPVSELVEQFIAAWGSGAWKDTSDPHQPHEAGLLRLSIEKALHELGWSPRFSVREAIARTAAWYRKFYEGKQFMREVCEQEIAAYQQGQEAHTQRRKVA